MKSKIKNVCKMMWIYLCFVGLVIYYRKTLVRYSTNGWKVGKIVFKQFVYDMADSYGFVSGKREISDECNLAKITYKNMRGELCRVSVPFIKSNVRCMKDKVVVLEKEKGVVTTYYNVTQEPGMVYTLSPKETGGVRMHVYPSDRGWNDKDFTIPDKSLLTITGNEHFPVIMPFQKEREEIEF